MEVRYQYFLDLEVSRESGRRGGVGGWQDGKDNCDRGVQSPPLSEDGKLLSTKRKEIPRPVLDPNRVSQDVGEGAAAP